MDDGGLDNPASRTPRALALILSLASKNIRVLNILRWKLDTYEGTSGLPRAIPIFVS